MQFMISVSPVPTCQHITYTTVPPNVPAKHLKKTIWPKVRLNPNSADEMDKPARERIRTGLRPIRSAARAQGIINII